MRREKITKGLRDRLHYRLPFEFDGVRYAPEITCGLVRDEDSCDELYPSYSYECTECGEEYCGPEEEYQYCPNCGAKVVDA
ncbi:hypothetical protein [Gordonibacter sp.]|uniref:hypothetical protein n=1 Tax=Gordonibacter sp. TaxID=1968902 RepID=UPI002FC7CCA8